MEGGNKAAACRLRMYHQRHFVSLTSVRLHRLGDVVLHSTSTPTKSSAKVCWDGFKRRRAAGAGVCLFAAGLTPRGGGLFRHLLARRGIFSEFLSRAEPLSVGRRGVMDFRQDAACFPGHSRQLKLLRPHLSQTLKKIFAR